jgi:hypothetical protein
MTKIWREYSGGVHKKGELVYGNNSVIIMCLYRCEQICQYRSMPSTGLTIDTTFEP